MSHGYAVPKRQVPVKMILAGQPPADFLVYLAEDAARHAGKECPSDLLAWGDGFIPAIDSGGRVVIFQRDKVLVLSVDAEYEADRPTEPVGEEEMTTVDVELRLEDGTVVNGDLTYWRPDGQRRVQDYLNSAEQFVPLRNGPLLHLVNRDRIVAITKM